MLSMQASKRLSRPPLDNARLAHSRIGSSSPASVTLRPEFLVSKTWEISSGRIGAPRLKIRAF